MRAPVTPSGVIAVALASAVLSGCVAQHRGDPALWFAERDAVMPRGNRVSVCHAFGCQLKTTMAFTAQDISQMSMLVGEPANAEAERAAVARLIAWAETRVAPRVGSANDEGGLDIRNAGTPGQMDCIDEAANTTSYLLVAQHNGLLSHHHVGRPVARGYFLDMRYPHATAVMVDASGTPWAVDSWPHPNGVRPDILPLEHWFAGLASGRADPASQNAVAADAGL